MKINRLLAIVLLSGYVYPALVFSQDFRNRPNPVYPAAARMHDSLAAIRVPLLPVPESCLDRTLPPVVDNTLNNYWSGIKDQFYFMSCQQYAGVGYVYNYEINRLRNQPGWYWENTYPTHYTLNFLNHGEWELGVDFLHSFDVIRLQGHMTSNDYGVDTSTSFLGWVSGYEKYFRGMSNRLKQVYAIEVNTIEGINTLKNYLNDHLDGSATGGIACFTTSSGSIYSMPTLPAGTPEAGKYVVPVWEPDPNHGLTVVGYNDSIRYDVNKDGMYTNNIDITGDGIVDARDWEYGAFKIANSYGASYWGDEGYTYALYRSFALNYEEGGVWNNRVYVVEADSAYHPLLTVKVSLDYNMRDKIRVLAGVSGDTTHQMPDHVIDFPIFNFQGGPHPMQGYDTISGSGSIEFGLDVTELLNFVPAGQKARFFLMVEERDPDHIGQGAISSASFIRYHNGTAEFQATAEAVQVKDNNITMVSTVFNAGKPTVQITTTGLPPVTPSQPVQVQLAAAGGRPPYDWTLTEEYISRSSKTPEPQITGTNIQVHYAARSFASVALPFSFPFYGQHFDSIYVNYFGFIAFEPQNLPAPYTTDEMGMLKMFSLIVPSFSQQYTYQSNKNDGIWFQADATRAIIRWKVSVTRYVTTSTNDFAVILYPDGRFEFCYGTMDNQGFNHSFYRGVSKGDQLNFDIQTQWNANEIAGKSLRYSPPVLPGGLNLSREGLLTVGQADSTVIYGLTVRAADAGRISDTKTLMLSSGLSIFHELVCGNDEKLKPGMNASLKMTVTNNGSQPMHNLDLRIRPADTLLLITDSVYTIPLLNPGQTLSVPSAFSFRMRHNLPNGFMVDLNLAAKAQTRSWKKGMVFQVSAPELVMEPPYLNDGYNGRLDPGEVAELHVNLQNKGGITATNLLLKLISPDPMVSIVSAPQITINELGVFSSGDFHFQVQASRYADAGTEITMELLLTDSSGVVKTLLFNLPIGTVPVAVVNLSVAQVSALAMTVALDSLGVAYHLTGEFPADLNRYASIFMILGTGNSGTHLLTDVEGGALAAYLRQGGNLYLESYNTWYYNPATMLHPMLHYTSQKVHAYFYAELKGMPATFTDSMSYVYTSPVNYAVFSLEPQAPAYSTLDNEDTPARSLEFAYDGSDYKTIGTMCEFSALSGAAAPSSQKTLMQRYLEFFDLNIHGPWPLFHAQDTWACRAQQVTFTDDSFDNIVSRTWEFEGGMPATSNLANPVVTYNTTGKYDVKLTVSDGTRTRTILKSKYIQVDYCSGEPESEAAASLFRIFPNPATGKVSVEINRDIHGMCTLTLYDLTGRILNVLELMQDGQNGRFMLDLSGIRKGMYFIRLQADNKAVTQKLMVN